ncbi:MAG: hypothetical protein F6K54_16175 [Okeania sp. SIO3B5]|uniref:hypothetical protein n=1 Tax=Okeania sp. SIO3B5 TaxID=2607811 RepID=UPI0013FFB216|nr:hypothetical protein [Okeania sp. SIO3B5]NEO54481.1 hypothetical protein [Okeania sp. SIO3B5]
MVPNQIQVADLKAALTTVGLDITIGPTVADDDDALPLSFGFMDALILAQTAQNNAVAEGERVRAVALNPTSQIVQVEFPIGSGTIVPAEVKAYSLTGRAIKAVVNVVPSLI